jgi:hypothetical protein
MVALVAGTAAVSALPASAVSTGCVSVDTRCQTYTCPTTSRTVINTGYTDTGPWVVVCAPKV